MRALRPAHVIPLLSILIAVQTGAEFPYPPNPLPCTGPTPPPQCVPANQYERYLFLPVTQPLTLPDDFGADWKLSSAQSGDPEIDANPQELFGVTGASVDRAWQVTTGRPDVVIAVLDSGIRWGEANEIRDLVNKFFLNRNELPLPEPLDSTDDLGSPLWKRGVRGDLEEKHSQKSPSIPLLQRGRPTSRGAATEDPYDANGDGVFNVRDYDGDPRVSDQNGNGIIDPEDLIFLFSDGVDDDANGYIDDISGWDFYEDDNDPLDEVQYGHGTGESRDSGGEANNGMGGVGTCPNCLLLEVRVGDSFIADVNDFAQGVLFAVDSGARVVQEALGTLNHSAFGQEAIDYAHERGVVVIASAADEESNHNNYPANYNRTIEVNSVTKFFDESGLTQTPKSYLYLNGCTNFGGHIILSVPSSSCSSEATGLSSGMAGLVVSAALNEIHRGNFTRYVRNDGAQAEFPLSADEIKQILISTSDDVNFDARDDHDPPLPQSYTTRVPVPGVQQSSRFPSIAGWDQYFGYGRINADAAVRRVREGRIPPEAVIDDPVWFSVLSSRMLAVDLTGRVAANRAESFSYVVDVAPGVQPHESDFGIFVSSPEETEPVEGTLATIPLSAVLRLLPKGTTGPPVQDDGSGRGDPERFAFTVRLRVTDNLGNAGEDRRTLFLHDDSDLVEGFPRSLGADGASAPVTADLDADGIEELILGTSNGAVHAFRLDGTELPGWPVFTDPIEVHAEAPAFASGAVSVPHGAILGGAVVGDLDRNGSLEVVAADLEGKVYAWNATGGRLPGFPVSTLPEYSNTRRSERDPSTPEGLVPDRVNRHDRDNRLGRATLGGPTLIDLDLSVDADLEIIAGAFDRHVYAWKKDGQLVSGWPVLLKDPTKVESVDPETNEVTLVEDANADIGTKIITSPSIAYLDGDLFPEVVVAVNEEYRERPNAVFQNPIVNLFIASGVLEPGNTRVYAIYANGTLNGPNPIERGWNPSAFVEGWPIRTTLLTTGILPLVGTGSDGSPAIADIDGDGLSEIATGSVFGPLYLFDSAGRSLLGTLPTGEALTFEADRLGARSNSRDAPTYGAFGGPVLVEFAGPGNGFHVIAPTAGMGKLLDQNLPARQRPADNHLSAWEMDGSFIEAFPREVNDLQFFVAPAVADITGDGLPEAIEGTGVWDLHAVNIEGIEPPGWPKFTGGWMVTSPTVGDLDGDGKSEVAAATREGNLFVWRTEGDACGFIPWRGFHHDEWGTGNYNIDARPPATLRELPRVSVSDDGMSATFALRRLPGDDLFCGEAMRYDVRYSTQPIETNADFEQATATAATVERNETSVLRVQDETFLGRILFFAMVVWDDAGNRSGVAPLGSVTFTQAAPTPSATPSPQATPTTTALPSPTQTTGGTLDSDSCQVTPPNGASAWPFCFAFLLWGMRRFRWLRSAQCEVRASDLRPLTSDLRPLTSGL